MSDNNLSVGVGVLGATGYIGEPYRAENRENAMESEWWLSVPEEKNLLKKLPRRMVQI